MKSFKKAVERIKKAIKNKEKIILFGDADLDGVTSVIILKESIDNLGGKVEKVYFPDREKQGYGINKTALKNLEKTAPALFISLDCGITNFEEVELAKSMGFEVIIIDHHQVLDKLPAAAIIVNPKQKEDKYPFKELATVGIVYKLSQVLLENQPSESLKNSFLELVALATIADMMAEIEENKLMIEQGLASLEKTFRIGLRAFFEIDAIKNQVFISSRFFISQRNENLNGEFDKINNIRQVAQKIVSTLNITKAKDHLNETYLLLTSNSFEEAKVTAERLFKEREQKQMRIKEITEEVEWRVSKKLKEPIVFEGDASWPLILLGSVSSKICNQYKKPTFILKIADSESRGAVRTPQGINGVDLMKSCSKLLITYGGHPRAAGFTVKNENMEKLRECLIKNL